MEQFSKNIPYTLTLISYASIYTSTGIFFKDYSINILFLKYLVHNIWEAFPFFILKHAILNFMDNIVFVI